MDLGEEQCDEDERFDIHAVCISVDDPSSEYRREWTHTSGFMKAHPAIYSSPFRVYYHGHLSPLPIPRSATGMQTFGW